MGVGLGGARRGRCGRRAARVAPRRIAAAVQPGEPVAPRPADLPSGAGGNGYREMRGDEWAGDRVTRTLTHLERLEAESVQIMREAVAESERPEMLISTVPG